MSLMTLGTAAVRTRSHHVPTFSPRRMRAGRLAAGLDFEQLAAALGRNARTVRRYESGQILPPADVIGAMSVLLYTSVADLFE